MNLPTDDYQIQWLAAARRPRPYSVAGSLLAGAFRSRLVSLVCVGVVLVALVLPAGGFGFPTCQFHALTGLPCFGCGLTRSFVGMAHLDFARAAFYHPGGVALFLMALLFGGLLPARPAIRERWALWAEERGRLLTYLAVAFLVLFIGYGLVRMGWAAMLLGAGRPSPW